MNRATRRQTTENEMWGKHKNERKRVNKKRERKDNKNEDEKFWNGGRGREGKNVLMYYAMNHSHEQWQAESPGRLEIKTGQQGRSQSWWSWGVLLSIDSARLYIRFNGLILHTRQDKEGTRAHRSTVLMLYDRSAFDWKCSLIWYWKRSLSHP